MTSPTSIAELLLARADDDRPALLCGDEVVTWAEHVERSRERAAVLGRRHVGILLDNVPEYSYWLGAAALSGGVVVGLNPTHRGAELERDIAHTECAFVVSDQEGTWRREAPAEAPSDGAAGDLFALIFTSGTSGAPKAVKLSQGRLAATGTKVAEMFRLTADDVCYCAMPLFHSNALMANWAPALAVGATIALRPKFSASAFLDDVRRHKATYFNYVGKPLAYILATPERPDDADNTLRLVFGNEAADRDVAEFGRRFGCYVVDGYGSSEGGASIPRTPDTPAGALGPAPPGVIVVDPATGQECPPARFDDDGQLTNADEAIGELANRNGAAAFEGYWKNDEAETERVHDGLYWTGDLAYKDADGYVYFAGRTADWLRVDGENIAAAPVERILNRHPDVVLAAVYGVPDEHVGDQLMCALQLRDGAAFDPDDFAAFLESQPDLGTKCAPKYVRITTLPVTQTNKVVKRDLKAEAWRCDDPVWVRAGRDLHFERLRTD